MRDRGGVGVGADLVGGDSIQTGGGGGGGRDGSVVWEADRGGGGGVVREWRKIRQGRRFPRVLPVLGNPARGLEVM